MCLCTAVSDSVTISSVAANWKSYFCNVDDKLASVALDLSLQPDAPVAGKQWLLWIWVYMRSPRPDGLSDNSEFENLCAIEDELAKQLSERHEALEAGRITTEGRREFYFYGEHPKDFSKSVRAAMSRFKEYRFDLGSEEDPTWNQYLNVLYPSDEDMQRILNRDVLENLRKRGDTLAAVRDVHHWIYFDSQADRHCYASEALELGYQIEREIEGKEDERPFGLIITRDQSLTRDFIDEAVIELFRLAKRLDAEYDGWEARVVPTAN